MSDEEREVLRFEERHPRNDRTKEAAVRGRFDQSWVRYQQRLLGLVRREDVVAEFPAVCRRVAEATARRVSNRARRVLG